MNDPPVLPHPQAGSMSGSPLRSWQPDPFRRHELRFRDGELWTEHVSDRGIAGVDTTPVADLPRSRPPDRTAGLERPRALHDSTVRVLAETAHGVANVADAQVLVVEESRSGVSGGNGVELGVSDEHGVSIGTVRVGREHLGAKALRLLSTAPRREATEVDLFDASGARVMSIDRPARFFKPRIVVSGPDGKVIGRLMPERTLSGLSYSLEAHGTPMGRIEGSSPRDREVRAFGADGTRVARVSTTWEVLAASHHPTANTYLIVFERAAPDPLHSLVLAGLLSLDSLLLAPEVFGAPG